MPETLEKYRYERLSPGQIRVGKESLREFPVDYGISVNELHVRLALHFLEEGPLDHTILRGRTGGADVQVSQLGSRLTSQN